MHNDNEITTVKEDLLQFSEFAETLQEIIEVSTTPISIGIYGEWGTGKTSLMKMTKSLLESNKNTKTVWFDAWKYEKTEEIKLALFYCIVKIAHHDILAPELNKIWSRLYKNISIQTIMNQPTRIDDLVLNYKYRGNLPEKSPEHEINSAPNLNNFNNPIELQNEFEELYVDFIEKYIPPKGRLVVFIDDLDRCLPDKAVEILESIKLFLNVKKTIFVIGADNQIIVNGIVHKYGDHSRSWGIDYLDKIIQVPFKLPPLRKELTRSFINELNISSALKKYADILSEVGDNPRTIKRLLNNFEFQRILLRKRKLEDLQENVLAKLLVIEYRWKTFFSDLVNLYSEGGINLFHIMSKNEEHYEGLGYLQEKINAYKKDPRLTSFLKSKPNLIDENLDLKYYIFLVKTTSEVKIELQDLFDLARQLISDGKYDDAIPLLEKANQLNTDNERNEIQYLFGAVYFGKNEFSKASEIFEKQKEIFKVETTEIYSYLFSCYQALSNFEKNEGIAWELWSRTKDSKYITFLYFTYQKNGDKKNLALVIETLLVNELATENVLNELLKIYREFNEFEKLKIVLEGVTAIHSNNKYKYELADIYQKEKKYIGEVSILRGIQKTNNGKITLKVRILEAISLSNNDDLLKTGDITLSVVKKLEDYTLVQLLDRKLSNNDLELITGEIFKRGIYNQALFEELTDYYINQKMGIELLSKVLSIDNMEKFRTKCNYLIELLIENNYIEKIFKHFLSLEKNLYNTRAHFILSVSFKKIENDFLIISNCHDKIMVMLNKSLLPLEIKNSFIKRYDKINELYND